MKEGLMDIATSCLILIAICVLYVYTKNRKNRLYGKYHDFVQKICYGDTRELYYDFARVLGNKMPIGDDDFPAAFEILNEFRKYIMDLYMKEIFEFDAFTQRAKRMKKELSISEISNKYHFAKCDEQYIFFLCYFFDRWAYKYRDEVKDRDSMWTISRLNYAAAAVLETVGYGSIAYDFLRNTYRFCEL